jgi:protein-S-isoprenylcysteine O-methyltransferase Ste14
MHGYSARGIVANIYILIAVKYLKEKDLRKFIGEKYETYPIEVPMIIPLQKFKNETIPDNA